MTPEGDVEFESPHLHQQRQVTDLPLCVRKAGAGGRADQQLVARIGWYGERAAAAS
jgi:hypothetical protein